MNPVTSLRNPQQLQPGGIGLAADAAASPGADGVLDRRARLQRVDGVEDAQQQLRTLDGEPGGDARALVRANAMHGERAVVVVEVDEDAHRQVTRSGEWVECEACGGEGVSGHDCGEDSCCCLNPIDNEICHRCDGNGFVKKEGLLA